MLMEAGSNNSAQLNAAKILAELNDALRICSEPAVLHAITQARQSVIEMLEVIVSGTLEKESAEDSSSTSAEL